MSDFSGGRSLRVRTGSREFAIPAGIVQEVADIAVVTPLPGVHPAIVGLANLRGALLTVIDLQALRDGGAGAARAVVVVVEAGGQRLGMAVDDVLALGPGEGGGESIDVAALVAPLFGP